ncbi:hypothetical protein [Microbispora sp. ATCC PTA-5024]|nr:hypothetical protein [Microbispora sp. ATCC PTA-5024]
MVSSLARGATRSARANTASVLLRVLPAEVCPGRLGDLPASPAGG